LRKSELANFAFAGQIIGNMFSGKSSDLIRQIRRYEISKKKCLLLKYHKDVRYSSVRPARCAWDLACGLLTQRAGV
jgi:hypothetical protein